MAIAFLHPRWLWLIAVCVPAVWMIAAAARSDEGRPRLAAALVRTVVVFGIVVAAAGPLRVTEIRAVSAVALLDVSASISDRDLAREQTLVQDLSRAAVPPHELWQIRFAAAPLPVEAVRGGEEDRSTARSTRVDRPPRELALGTDIASALGVAAGVADPARERRVIVFSDGCATTGDALAQASHLAAMGIRVDQVTLGGAGGDAAADVAVDSLSAPGDIQPRATFPLRVRIAANAPSRVRVTVTRDGQPFGDARVETVDAGETTLTWDARVDVPGEAVFTATVERQGAPAATGAPRAGKTARVGPGTDSGTATGTPTGTATAAGNVAQGGDAHPENDRGVLAIATDTSPRVLVLARASADAAPLVAVLRAQSMDVVTVTAAAASGRVPDAALTAAEIARADLVVLCDLPRTALSERALGAIEAHVRDGAGLLVTGGPHAFGPGDWARSRLESLLPVRLALPEKRDEAALALALVIDRSGSMSGAKMELTKRAARATADMLPPDDQITVVVFDREATTIVPMQRAANRIRIGTDIARIQATGGTNILAGLREALDHLAVARAKKKHAILLSDGQSNTEGIVELVDAAAAARITISVVGVGDGVDDGLLQLIAGNGGGRYYHTRDPASIPRIFTRETSQVAASGIVEQPTTVMPRKHVAMLGGVTIERAPRLDGYVRTVARPDAELLLATDTGDPVLARWAIGLGQVVAWTSDLGPRWAEAWARWPSFAKFWGQVARGTMRARSSPGFALAVTRAEAGTARVTVDAVDSDDQVLSGMEGVLELTEVVPEGVAGVASAAKSRRRVMPRVPLVEAAPGRYDAIFNVRPAGGGSDTAGAPGASALLLQATFTRDGRSAGGARGHLSLPSVPELSPLPASPTSDGTPTGGDLLAAIAARTGGGALVSTDGLFAGARPRRTERPLRVPVLVCVSLLFVADVAQRRLRANRGTRRSNATPRRSRG